MLLRAWVLLMLALSVGVGASAARAQRDEFTPPLRALLRVQDPRDEELLLRLRGQTSDLPVTLERMAAEIAPAAHAQRTAAVFALCAQHDADVLLWAEWPEPGDTSVWIALATCGDRRLFARQVTLDGGTDGASSSGLTEACALVLRGALGVLSQGGTIGVQVEARDSKPRTSRASGSTSAPEEPTGAPAPAALEAAAPTAIAPPATRPATPISAAAAPAAPARSFGPTAPLQFYGALAVQEAWDGASARGQPALQVGLALGGRVHQAALSGNVGLPIALSDAYTRITLSRHGIALGWRMNAWRRGPWRLRVGADLGMALYQRAVQAESAQARPRDSQLAFAPLLAGSLELQRALGPVWLALGAGVDGVLLVPLFVYQTESGQRDALTLWPLVPRISLALCWESP